jgi:hypothetical protein
MPATSPGWVPFQRDTWVLFQSDTTEPQAQQPLVCAGPVGGDAGAEQRVGLRLAANVGGYADFRRLLRAMIAGEHEWRGRRYRSTPDAYGRWIVGAQLLRASTATGTGRASSASRRPGPCTSWP